MSRTVAEQSALVGQRALLGIDLGQGTLAVWVDVLDARSPFGRQDIKVRPLHGAGEVWVAEQRVIRWANDGEEV